MKPNHASYNVLVVDSSQLVVNRINEQLKELDCIDQIIQAHNYSDAIKCLSGQSIDIVLLDTQLQGASGFELLSTIKATYPEIITIILTNQTSDYYKLKVEKMGYLHFIDKSAEFDSVADIINNYAFGIQMN